MAPPSSPAAYVGYVLLGSTRAIHYSQARTRWGVITVCESCLLAGTSHAQVEQLACIMEIFGATASACAAAREAVLSPN